MRIMKFGGKSLDTPQKMQNICRFIKKVYKKDSKIIIVVSAIGKTTDSLLNLIESYNLKKQSPRELDVLLSTGETQSSAIFAMNLNSFGVPAKSLQAFQINLSTFGDFQNSLISHIDKKVILDCINNGFVAVISGFQGINKDNEITTLGRGGSDTTASALGAIFNQDIEIYSDFDGIFSGDPKTLSFKKIKNINFNSMIDVANAGAKVLDARATTIANNHNKNIICKQSSNPKLSGSLISNIEKSFIIISEIDNLCKLTITFSHDKDYKLIVKNVINCISDIKSYNFNINNNKIELYIPQDKKTEVIFMLSKKLKILK